MNVVIIILMVLGILMFFGGSVGIIRFPDFYSRLHPAGKMDTLAALLMLSGVALYNVHHFTVGSLLTSIKLFLIVAFVFLASPTATHAIVDAGLRAGLKFWQKGQKRR